MGRVGSQALAFVANCADRSSGARGDAAAVAFVVNCSTVKGAGFTMWIPPSPEVDLFSPSSSREGQSCLRCCGCCSSPAPTLGLRVFVCFETKLRDPFCSGAGWSLGSLTSGSSSALTSDPGRFFWLLAFGGVNVNRGCGDEARGLPPPSRLKLVGKNICGVMTLGDEPADAEAFGTDSPREFGVRAWAWAREANCWKARRLAIFGEGCCISSAVRKEGSKWCWLGVACVWLAPAWCESFCWS